MDQVDHVIAENHFRIGEVGNFAVVRNVVWWRGFMLWWSGINCGGFVLWSGGFLCEVVVWVTYWVVRDKMWCFEKWCFLLDQTVRALAKSSLLWGTLYWLCGVLIECDESWWPVFDRVDRDYCMNLFYMFVSLCVFTCVSLCFSPLGYLVLSTGHRIKRALTTWPW